MVNDFVLMMDCNIWVIISFFYLLIGIYIGYKWRNKEYGNEKERFE